MKVLFRCQSAVLRLLQRFTADNGLRWTKTLKEHSRYARKPSTRTEPQVLRFNPHQKLDGIVRPCLRSVFLFPEQELLKNLKQGFEVCPNLPAEMAHRFRGSFLTSGTAASH